MIRHCAALIVSTILLAMPLDALAQTAPMVSQCMVVAEALPPEWAPVFIKVYFAMPVPAEAPVVTIRYAGHSTFVIETPGCVVSDFILG